MFNLKKPAHRIRSRFQLTLVQGKDGIWPVMRTKSCIFLAIVSFFLLFHQGIGNAAVLVVNGGFEEPYNNTIFQPSGWELSHNDPGTPVTEVCFREQDFKRSGDWSMALGTEPGFEGQLSQTLATVAGQNYELTYWLCNRAGSSQGAQYYWQTTIGTSEHLGFSSDEPGSTWNWSETEWREMKYQFTAAGTTTSLEFAFNNDFFWNVDDVHLAAVPEPAQVVSSACAVLFGAALVYRQRSRRC